MISIVLHASSHRAAAKIYDIFANRRKLSVRDVEHELWRLRCEVEKDVSKQLNVGRIFVLQRQLDALQAASNNTRDIVRELVVDGFIYETVSWL
jgi:hypothetical protein